MSKFCNCDCIGYKTDRRRIENDVVVTSLLTIVYEIVKFGAFNQFGWVWWNWTRNNHIKILNVAVNNNIVL